MVSFIEKTIKRVAIIGGGPGGIAAARALRNEGTFETITIYERNDHTGGTWNYSPETNTPPPIPSTNALTADSTLKKRQLHSPIYRHLHTNLPHQVMCFQDRPMPQHTPDFLHHSYVMDYLSQLAYKENLLPILKFHTLVENAEFENDVWKVSAEDLRSGETWTEEFDAVVVATGHYAVPYVPDIPGLIELNENRRIKILHSRDYRVPDSFKGKNVLVVGGGSSAIDIVREVSTVATNVYQCIRTQTELSRQAVARNAPNVHQIDLVQEIVNQQDQSFVRLQNGQEIKDLDTIIFGTGYLYSFPFLPFQKDNLIVTGQKVHNLDHYMFYQKNPTLCFLGLPIRVVPMPLMQRQSIVMARYWSGKIPMVPHEHTSTPKVLNAEGKEDDRLEFIMGVTKEFDYSEKLGAWAEGWTNPDIEQWHSNDLLTGRLFEQWKELRKNALALRREQLGY